MNTYDYVNTLLGTLTGPWKGPMQVRYHEA